MWSRTEQHFTASLLMDGESVTGLPGRLQVRAGPAYLISDTRKLINEMWSQKKRETPNAQRPTPNAQWQRRRQRVRGRLPCLLNRPISSLPYVQSKERRLRMSTIL